MTDIINIILFYAKRYWYLSMILVIYIVILSWRTIGCVKLSIPLRLGGLDIAHHAIVWWNNPEEIGGANRRPLDQVDFIQMELNPNHFSLLETKLHGFSYWRKGHDGSKMAKTREYVTYSKQFGFFEADLVPPHHIILSGSNGNYKHFALVRFDVKIDLTKSHENVKIRIKHKWL